MHRRRHTFYRQSSCTFSYYGRVGSHRYRYRRANAAFLIKPSRSMNDIYEMEKRQKQRNGPRTRHQSGNTNSSGDTESEEDETETTVRLLWMSMLKMPKKLFRLCVCHLVTWFSIIAEAVFYTDFMGQVIYEGDPTVSDALLFFMHLKSTFDQVMHSLGIEPTTLALLIPCFTITMIMLKIIPVAQTVEHGALVLPRLWVRFPGNAWTVQMYSFNAYNVILYLFTCMSCNY